MLSQLETKCKMFEDCFFFLEIFILLDFILKDVILFGLWNNFLYFLAFIFFFEKYW
jgi:hypothetical protein